MASWKSSISDARAIIAAHCRAPSIAAVNAIGEHYVFNGAPDRVVRAGLEALRELPSPAAVAILAKLPVHRSRAILAFHALSIAKSYLEAAVARGYTGLTIAGIGALARSSAKLCMNTATTTALGGVATDLFMHLNAAAAHFQALPAI